MSNLTCPKCGGTDSFVSQRNIVKGRGIFVSGKMRSVAVCKACNEIMSRGQTIETTMPTTKMATGDLRKFYAPHVVILILGLVLSFLPNFALSTLGVFAIQVDIIVLIIRLVIRKRRSMGIF